MLYQYTTVFEKLESDKMPRLKEYNSTKDDLAALKSISVYTLMNLA